MELLTGKNKEQFEKWFTSDSKYYEIICIAPRSNYDDAVLDSFDLLPFEMQLGVLLVYFDSYGYYCEHILEYEGVKSLLNGDSLGCYTSTKEAYKEAFKKANELVNNNLLNQNK